ncbi:hypothetical protein niasHT_004633 [Heterodera trifolii]|uniref:Uncharacterized protein n=1 Tax=Heterodera trifolii TaxID=157864 RepID=A0ABD2M7N8_9BILA
MEGEQLENDENISPTRVSPTNAFGVQKNGHLLHNFVEPGPLTTKIYYYVDDQQIPFSTEIAIPPSKITLADFKKCITRRNYRYYCKVMDPALNAEVKTDIRDENALLKPNSTNGRFELFLLSETQTHSSASTLPIQKLQHVGAIRTSLMEKRTTANYICDVRPKFIDDSISSPEEDSTNLRLFGESNLEGITGSIDDSDSQYTTDFTSVSQQNPHVPTRTFAMAERWCGDSCDDGKHGHGHHHHQQQRHRHRPAFVSTNKRYDSNNKPCWTREKRKRTGRRSFTALSSTFEDTTEASMSLEMITVTFNLDSRRPFGMSIVTKNNRSGFAGIYVHEVNPGGLVALDGRIRPGFIILEVNDISLDDLSSKEALNLIISSVRNATETRGQLKLVCAPNSESVELARNVFHPILAEPVRPIDPTAWIQHTNAARGLDHQLQHFPLHLPTAHSQGQQPPICCVMPSQCQPNATKPMANKSSTIPKTNPQQQGKVAVHEKQQQFSGAANCAVDGDIRMIQNPSTDITTTESGISSVECSIGQLEPSAKAKGAPSGNRKRSKTTETKKRRESGGIGTALRRLVCIRTTKRGGKGNGGEKKNG